MKTRKRKKSPVAAVCSALGTVILVVIVLMCIPLTIPKVAGYQIYTVVSGSMEPAIPTGSLVYVKWTEPEQIEKGDVIAFYGTDVDGSIITHRVVSNSSAMGTFITKGDANSENDMNPIPYDNYIGKMKLSVPIAGGVIKAVTEGSGKFVAFLVIGIAIVLQLVAVMLERKEENMEERL